MKLVAIAIGALLVTTPSLMVASPASAQSPGEKTGINSTLGLSPTTSDFVKEAAISDMFEIQSSKLALERGNATEKSFATQMIADHTKTSTELKGLVHPAPSKPRSPLHSTARIRANSTS